MDTKALKVAAVAATMLDGFSPTTWTPLPDLGTGVRVLLDDNGRSLVASAAIGSDRSADVGSETEAGRLYDAVYPHADFAWTRVRATTEVGAEYFSTASATTVTLRDPLPGAPLGDAPIADAARASSLAQTLAALHSASPEPVAEAGFPIDDPARDQFRILTRLDQAAATGRVPSPLLQHWEEEFEKVELWHFLATPVHGSIDESTVWTDQERVLALSGISRLRVADPALDLAAAAALIDPAVVSTFFTEYQQSRPQADEHIVVRAELLAEFAVLDWLLEAVESEDESAVDDAAALLQNFNEVLLPAAEQTPAPDSTPAPQPTSAPESPSTSDPTED